MSQNAPPTSQPQPHSEPPKPARPKLHSPILGGGGDPQDFVDEPQVAPGKRTLRSPLLGGADEGPAEDVSSQNKNKNRKAGGLRSPLLGGGDDDFDAPSKPGAFPHRNRAAEPVNEEPHSAFPHRSKNSIPAQPASEDAQAKPRKGGLHSPLLGGGQDDFDEPMPRGGNSAEQRPSGNFGRRRLHSPVLDGTGTFDYEAFAEEESGYNEDDPNVLRSPLLAAKSKLPASEKLPPPIPEQPNRTAAVVQTKPPAAQPTSSTPAYKPLTSPAPADIFAPPPTSTPADAPPAGTAPASVSKSDQVPAAKARPAALNPTGEHVRVPLSIYDSGLRETIPGAIKTGPAWIIVIPSIIGLAAKGFYLMQLVQVPRFADQTGFLVDYAGQILVLIGLLIFGMTAGRK